MSAADRGPEWIDVFLGCLLLAMMGGCSVALYREHKNPPDQSAHVRLMDGREMKCRKASRSKCGYDLDCDGHRYECVQGVEVLKWRIGMK